MVNMRWSSAVVWSSVGFAGVILRRIAFSCPRWSPNGEVDVDSRHRLYDCMSSSTWMIWSIGVTFPNGIFRSIICVASGSEDMSVSMVPCSRAFVGLLIPFGPKIVFIGDRVKGHLFSLLDLCDYFSY